MHDSALDIIISKIKAEQEELRREVCDTGHKSVDSLHIVNYKLGAIEMGDIIIDKIKEISKVIYEEDDNDDDDA
jgi:hypothetical protein